MDPAEQVKSQAKTFQQNSKILLPLPQKTRVVRLVIHINLIFGQIQVPEGF
jgi:hypothetical protein